VDRGLTASRSRARDLIKRGCVSVDGEVAGKAGQEVGDTAAIAITGDGLPHVSRAGIKLAAALEAFALSAAGRTALDIGASTGGFTEVLLRAGAAKVYAVDVGRGQLHPSLRCDPRVIDLERLDARRISRTEVPEPVGAIVADVSFISLTKVLPAALGLAASDAWLIALIKPQFELEPAAIGKRGIVKDPAARERAVGNVRQCLAAQPGWRVLGVIASPIAGGSGNQEFLIGARRDG
jgi:23S rRNA (cytidine1920-2'-O)/16S rRNA (cytidine1409-2'-O)-methyltransferase